MIAKLMTRSGEREEDLVALAQKIAKQSATEGGHSPGRRFHDELHKLCEAADRGDLYLTSVDLE